MITAVDTNVLLDLFLGESPFHAESRDKLVAAYDAGAIVICDIVYAELVPRFDDRTALDSALQEINAVVSPIDTGIAYEAGLRWTRYRRSGGTRERILPDFLIGAHAIASADTFLTRDRRFFASYFPDLKMA
ncbi:MAG: type II toxin-antitoxin system VapC family toxin [Dehalococcoidia bacterium]|nr:type II toxin-antitoxin system VapC family toxin [Dehalococcoidia bacterium]